MTSHCLSYVGCVRSSAIAVLVILGTTWSPSGSSTALHASAPSAQTPLVALAPDFRLEGPFTHANLAVYVVRGSTSDVREYITLDEGFTARTVAVHEKGTRAGQDQAEVNTLEIENRSDKWLFLQAGDIVKGGKQDRTIMTDLTLAPRSGPQPLEAFCVEHGRWTPSGDGLAFRNNPGIVAGAPLKIAIQGEKSQPRVWQEVAKAEERAVTAARAGGAALMADAALSSTGTYNAIAQHKTLSANRDVYVTALLPYVRRYSDALGLAVAINGKVTSADVYASAALFQRLSAKLLNSYALEGVLAHNGSQPVAAPPTTQQVIALLSKPAAARTATETIGESMQRSTRETDEAVVYQYGHVKPATSKQPGVVVVHQNYLKK
jgi:hypothetical protein